MTAQNAERGLRPGGPGIFRGGVRAFSSWLYWRGFSFVFCARIAARTSPGAAGTTTFAGLRRERGGVRERRRARMAARRSPPPVGAGRRAGLAWLGRAPSERARIAAIRSLPGAATGAENKAEAKGTGRERADASAEDAGPAGPEPAVGLLRGHQHARGAGQGAGGGLRLGVCASLRLKFYS